MKVILYMATTIDGFVATKEGNSDWVSEVDTPIFEGKIKKTGCIVLGRKTFDQYKGELYPNKDALNIVLTSKEVSGSEDGVKYANSPYEAKKIAEMAGYSELLLIGGGTANGSFLRDNLIDEIFLDIHPLTLGDGIKVFEGVERNVGLKLVEKQDLQKGLTLMHFEVLK